MTGDNATTTGETDEEPPLLAAGVEVAVPPGEQPGARCPYCDRPFTAERLRALHVGERHPGAATAAEREAFEAAYDAESDELFVYHLKVIAGIVVLVFTIAYTFAFVLM